MFSVVKHYIKVVRDGDENNKIIKATQTIRVDRALLAHLEPSKKAVSWCRFRIIFQPKLQNTTKRDAPKGKESFNRNYTRRAEYVYLSHLNVARDFPRPTGSFSIGSRMVLFKLRWNYSMEVKYRHKKASLLVLLVQNSSPKLICFVKLGLCKKSKPCLKAAQ